MAGGLARGEVRLYRFPSPDKTRPVVVLTRTAVLPFLNAVTVAPITSTIRGLPSEVLLTEDDGMKSVCAVNLQGVMTVAQIHIGRRVTQLNAHRMNEVCSALRFSLGCDDFS